MKNTVLFIEGFNEIPAKITDYIQRGWTVYNAPRPLYGHDTWQDDFRHGIFFAAVAPDGSPEDEFNDAPRMHDHNRRYDGYKCQIVSKESVMAYGAKVAEKYKVTLDKFSYDEIVRSMLGWLDNRDSLDLSKV